MSYRSITETERFFTRPWDEKDIYDALKLWGDPDVMRHIDVRGGLSEDQVREKFDRQISIQREYGISYWALCLESTQKVIGCCGLRPYSVLGEDLYDKAGLPLVEGFEIGFHLMSDHWGRGYAREAAVGAIAFAKSEVGAAKLFAGHNPENGKSRKLLESLGFKFTRCEFYPPTGLLHPTYELDLARNTRCLNWKYKSHFW